MLTIGTHLIHDTLRLWFTSGFYWRFLVYVFLLRNFAILVHHSSKKEKPPECALDFIYYFIHCYHSQSTWQYTNENIHNIEECSEFIFHLEGSENMLLSVCTNMVERDMSCSLVSASLNLYKLQLVVHFFAT